MPLRSRRTTPILDLSSSDTDPLPTVINFFEEKIISAKRVGSIIFKCCDFISNCTRNKFQGRQPRGVIPGRQRTKRKLRRPALPTWHLNLMLTVTGKVTAEAKKTLELHVRAETKQRSGYLVDFPRPSLCTNCAGSV